MSNKKKNNIFKKASPPPPVDTNISEVEHLKRELEAIANLFWMPSERPKGRLAELISSRIDEMNGEAEIVEEPLGPPTLQMAYLETLNDVVNNGGMNNKIAIVDLPLVQKALEHHRTLSGRDAATNLQQLQMAAGIATTAAPIVLAGIRLGL